MSSRVIEFSAESDKSWEDATQNALLEASLTVDGIREIWVSGQKAIVENGRIVRYRITGIVVRNGTDMADDASGRSRLLTEP